MLITDSLCLPQESQCSLTIGVDEKAGIKPAFSVRCCADWSYYALAASAPAGCTAPSSGRSSNSTYAIGALSPLRNPYFRMRR